MTYGSPQLYAVQCRGVRKSFGAGNNLTSVLRDIDLDVPQGKITMLVGPSGCGKTTLISIIAGILRPDEGHCEIMGFNPSTISSVELSRFRSRHIGFIFQSYHLLPSLTVEANVAIPLLVRGAPYEEAILTAQKILGEVELSHLAKAMPSDLSGGQQQRVAIARGIIHQPSVLVCDEPTSALDHATGVLVMDLLSKAVKEHNITLIVVTHDNRIFQYADYIAHMDDGQITSVEEKLQSQPL